VNRVVCACLALACSAHDRAPEPAKRTAPPPPLVAPGLRLPDGVAPLAYDLRLELDPDRDEFHGHVEIRVHLDAPTDHVWIHASELDITQASFRDGNTTGKLEPLPLAGEQMRAFGFGRVLEDREIALGFDYTGHTLHDQEGLFRQREDGRWYLFSQGESVFARRILPCFDEPRFKVPWKVTIVAPKDQIVLANAPEVFVRARGDGRREHVFAEMPAMASYQLAVAVGPFELVDVGPVGKLHVPARVAALAGQRDRVGVAVAKLPEIVATTEDFLVDTLPLAKLDLVVVPHLFGAMENPGLVTIEEIAIVGDAQRKPFAHKFVRMMAHEVVHQWFGNLVTPAWWDDLWLAEAFASWLGDRIAAKLDAFDDVDLYFALARRDALAADDEPDAKPLRRKIASTEDADGGFDTIAYEKGAAVLEMFDRTSLAWDRAVQSFLRAHRGRAATTRDLVTALPDELASALVGYIDHTGAPVVELALRCEDARATLDAHARGGMTVPVCLRYGDKATSMIYACRLVGDRAAFDLTLPDGCPKWVFGNRTAGYYQVAWQGRDPLGPLPPIGELSSREVMAAGDDVVAALYRGDIAAREAIGAMRELAATGDLHAQLAALAIAQALDPFVDDAVRPAWSKALAAAFAPRLTAASLLAARSSLERELRDALVLLVPPSALPADTAKRAARELDFLLAAPGAGPDPALVSVAAPIAGRATFDHISHIARDNRDPDVREASLDSLGRFGADQLPRALEFFLSATDVPADEAWAAVAGYLARGATRGAAWRAVRARLPELFARLPADEAPALLQSAAALCDAAARDEVAAAFEPHVRDLADGKRELARTLAAIDRCVARRIRAGDIAAALRN
jgi:alanyl aminopeptidase